MNWTWVRPRVCVAGGSEILPATRPATPAGQRSLVLRLAVVAGDFFSALDGPARIELDVATEYAHVRVRRAGVIDIAEFVAADRGVYRSTSRELNYRDPASQSGASSCLAERDPLAAQLAELSARRYPRAGENPLAVNRAASYVEQCTHRHILA